MNKFLGLYSLTFAVLFTTAAEEVTVHRDGFGVPHIYAETEAGCGYGMGWCQAEDRMEGVLQNYRRAEGTMAEVFGPEHYNADLRARMWRHLAKSREHYMKKSPRIRAITEGYVAGFKAYMAAHPERVPAWAPEVTRYHISAVGRLLIWGWPEGEAADDLRRGGLQYAPNEYHGSNQWLVTPDRTEAGAVIACIDPHLSWYGLFRFYEARYYGGELAYSGMAVPGLPLATLGHSRYCSVAMTTGGPDTADVYYFTVNPDNPRQYRYNGAWRDMEVIEERIGVKQDDGVEWNEVEFEYTHLGPVVARQDGYAYVMALPYFEEIYHLDQVYAMNTARGIDDMYQAFDMRQYMAQNIMVGTVDGDILYFRNGRVPIRPEGFDFERPVLGDDPASAWLGIHEIEDLVQVLNPPQGYMQNNNVSPFAMMKDSPLLPENYPAYIYGAGRTPPHQRAAMTLEQLHADDSVSVEDAFEIAMSTEVYGAEAWQARLTKAMRRAELSGDAETLGRLIREWDAHSDRDSVGATAYYYWTRAIIDQHLDREEERSLRYGAGPPERLTDENVLESLGKAAAALRSEQGVLEVPYGDIFRVGRRNDDGSYSMTWPVGGGNPGSGMATPRNIGFTGPMDGVRIGRSGQTSTQLVVLTKPPKSWTYLPLGESDVPESGHYVDQARELFSKRQMKPTFFMDEEGLMAEVKSTTTLTFQPEQGEAD